MRPPDAPLVVVVGPTASGKSDLALALAQAAGGEVISCDSLQVYRGFDLGTAKLPPGERQGIPHHLIDVTDPQQVFTAGDFAELAGIVLLDITRRGALPIIAGGSGFYLRALLEGSPQAPVRDETLRARLAAIEGRAGGRLHRLLRRLDPQRAARIHPNDVQKTVRAVEICILSRRPASSFAGGPRPLRGYRPLKIGLSPQREQLVEKVTQRAERMFQQGLVEEVRGLLDRGLPASAKPLESLGYKEALAVIEGRLAVEEAVARTALETRQYVKRQMTWFRRESDVHWLEGFGSEARIQKEALRMTREYCYTFEAKKGGTNLRLNRLNQA